LAKADIAVIIGSTTTNLLKNAWIPVEKCHWPCFSFKGVQAIASKCEGSLI